jgi:DNA-directed RNA polymerase specialized sigma24 family protein
MEDSALIEAARRGDQLAFERLLRRYRRMLDVHASRFYLPGGDADDIVQEARTTPGAVRRRERRGQADADQPPNA